jgi:ABC-type transport system involved in multi-copper enzyme maturation permease subunit
MSADAGRRAPELLHYRPWQGTFRPAWVSTWPVARTALGLMLRRKLFWGLYAMGLFVFLMFFFGQYLAAFAAAGGEQPRGAPPLRQLLYRVIRFMDGSGETYRTFLSYQGYIVMTILALAGSVVVGNDLRFGSLPFYLSKPVTRRHYLLGKGLAVAVFINMMTTLPALALFVEYALLYPDEWTDKLPLLPGILGYGAVLTFSLTFVLLATAAWLRKTVPLIMVWTTLFVFFRFLSEGLVNDLGFSIYWRLIDLWNCTYVVGNACLGMPPMPRQAHWPEAALVLAGVSLSCLIYAILRVRAVEVVK